MSGASKKLRSDAKLAALDRVLTPVEREELQRIAQNGSLADLQAFGAAHGVPLPLATASRTAAKLRAAAQRIVEREQVLRAIRAAAAKSGTTLTQAALEQSVVAIGDILDAGSAPETDEGQKLLLSGLSVLTGVRNSEIAADRVRASREALALAERRVKLLEAKQAEAGQVVADKTLSAAERERKLKDIFGIA